MSNDGLIIEYIDLSHIHLVVNIFDTQIEILTCACIILFFWKIPEILGVLVYHVMVAWLKTKIVLSNNFLHTTLMLHRPVNYAYVRIGGSSLNLGGPDVQIIVFWGVVLKNNIRNGILITLTITLLRVQRLWRGEGSIRILAAHFAYYLLGLIS